MDTGWEWVTMFLKENAFRTFLGLAILAGGVLWIAISAIHHDGIGNLVAAADIFPRISGSGHIIDQHRDIGDVDSIELEGSYDASIRIGSSPALTITTDDNIVPEITSDVEDGNLVVSSKGSISPSDRIRLAITVPSLHALKMNSGKVSITGIAGGDLKLSIEGSGKIDGAGKLEGLTAEIEGSGDLNLADLEAARVRVDIEGSGRAAVKATQSLDVEIDGSGRVTYSGQPAHVGREISGSGRIEPAA